MRRLFVTIGCSLAALPALAAEPGSGPVRVVLVGDSITVGAVSEPRGPSYAEQLEGLLGKGFEVANLGVKGSSSADWRKPGFLEEIESHLPAEIATVLLGTNDSVGFREARVSLPEEYGRAIERLVEALLVFGAERVVLMTPPPSHRPERTERLLGYREQILSICSARERVVCGPDVFGMLSVETDFERETIHPNGRGHRKIAEALARSIRAVARSGPGRDAREPAAATAAERGGSGSDRAVRTR